MFLVFIFVSCSWLESCDSWIFHQQFIVSIYENACAIKCAGCIITRLTDTKTPSPVCMLCLFVSVNVNRYFGKFYRRYSHFFPLFLFSPVIWFTQNKKNAAFSCERWKYLYLDANGAIFWLAMRFNAQETYHRNMITKCKSKSVKLFAKVQMLGVRGRKKHTQREREREEKNHCHYQSIGGWCVASVKDTGVHCARTPSRETKTPNSGQRIHEKKNHR